MLVIGGIIDAGRQHRDARLAGTAGRCERSERLAQQIGVILHPAHAVFVEEFREHLHHRFAVFQHVADTGGGAGIVFQNVELVFASADNVSADNMGVDAAGRSEADHFRQEGFVFLDDFAGNAPGADDFLLVVDIVEESIEGENALFDALGQFAPLAAGDDARDDIEGDQFF
ncbi:hypothetical protein D3C78_1196750 [compost metagenome]